MVVSRLPEAAPSRPCSAFDEVIERAAIETHILQRPVVQRAQGDERRPALVMGNGGGDPTVQQAPEPREKQRNASAPEGRREA
ncbi:hypothetical protein CDS [Bradyrhizobium sp.]|nr:hypothetical protein CDS [Bradyrhizobium sp.]